VAAVAHDPPGCLDPVDEWHPHVHQDDIRTRPIDRRHSVAAVAGLAHDLDVRLAVEDEAKARADEFLVVDDQDANLHQFSSSGSTA
jgi:hypothetical protein